MAVDAVHGVAPALDRLRGGSGRARWLAATLVLTIVPLVALPLLAPSGSDPAPAGLGLVLFVGSSIHVAATGWFYCVPDVRRFMRQHPVRYLAAPVLLTASGVVAALTLSAHAIGAVLLAFFGWQFVHFQKQNLGVSALAARAYGVAVSPGERRALRIAAGAVVLGLLGRPDVLQVADAPRVAVLFPAGAAIFAASVVTGLALLARRTSAARPGAYVLAYGTSLLFFLPVWLFRSPYAALAGLTIAHGLQYLLLMTLVAAGEARRRGGRRAIVIGVLFVDVAVLLGLALNHFSHLHAAPGAGRALFGVYLGLTASHFVADAGLWRLRDAFPRTFLTERLPYLLARAAQP